jgi:DNA processing protein
VLALAKRARFPWWLLARLLEDAGSAVAVAAGERNGFEQPELLEELNVPVTDSELEEFESLIDELQQKGVSLATVLDNTYPAMLRLAYDRPPFLFWRGELRPADERAIAVVGTRQATPAGLEQARALARELADRDVTVLSGLALGIDGAAHEGALDGRGRTVAVMGTGMGAPIYPREHTELADRIIAGGGALVSQFHPSAPPARYRFPLRNRTMSGLAQGTVVVEASSTSGARMQARLALEHDRRVFLVRDLVMQEQWARRYSEHPGATVVESATDVLEVLDSLPSSAEQLTLA